MKDRDSWVGRQQKGKGIETEIVLTEKKFIFYKWVKPEKHKKIVKLMIFATQSPILQDQGANTQKTGFGI